MHSARSVKGLIAQVRLLPDFAEKLVVQPMTEYPCVPTEKRLPFLLGPFVQNELLLKLSNCCPPGLVNLCCGQRFHEARSPLLHRVPYLGTLLFQQSQQDLP